ncbi:elongator complex protein 1-like [Styela clava]
MKNLVLLTCINATIPKLHEADVYIAIDSDTGRVYINTTTDIIGVDPTIDEETFAIGLEELGDACVNVTGLQYLQGEDSICVSTDHGDLVVVNVLTKLVESVGTVDSGLLQMKWSPDQELLLLGTGHNSIIVMTREFDPVAELDINASEFGEGQFITVGWGKKETQFHGSEGKGAAVKKNESIEPALLWDDRKIRIVWRGDGQYFAVGMIDPVNGNRKFRVWNRECVLQYTSEYIGGLESALAWRPSGNLLVSSQRKPHRHDIVFFEKNGLQHGEFTLPFGKDEMEVKYLEWNSDSSILMIWLTNLNYSKKDVDKSKTDETSDCLQFWTMSNYHWYLKQSVEFKKHETPSCVQWDAEQSHRLHIVCKNGKYRQFVFGKTVNDSNIPVLCDEKEVVVNGHHDNGVKNEETFVAVVDGKSILMTPFQHMCVPPPMSAYKLMLPNSANSVAFSPLKDISSDISVFMKNGEVAMFTMENIGSDAENLQDRLSVKLDAAGGNGFIHCIKTHVPKSLLKIETEIDDAVDTSALHHWIWLNESKMFAVSPGMLPGIDLAVLFEIDFESKSLKAIKITEIRGLVLSAILFNSSCVLIQLQDGTILKCDIPSLGVSDYTLPSGQPLKFPRSCPQVTSCSFDGDPCIVGLSEHFRMYINDTEIASDCSSFSLHNDFLFMTTHSHKLRCISRKISLENVLKYYTTQLEGRSLIPNCEGIETERAVERGSKIITVTPSDSRLILQMPRGNLELIHPRNLVLSLVKSLITSLKYGEAFTVMKKHRINMNLLYDIDKKMFEENIETFVKALDSTTNLNIFISDLQNEDLTQTMYKQYFLTETSKENNNATSSNSSVNRKINNVSDILIVELEKSEKRFISSLVTADVKKKPSEVGKALKRIKILADDIGHEEKLISNVLKYMTVLVDSNTLFNEALGTYDFKLVLMVAEKSQLDPKEFLPMLHELQSLEENYRKFKIDSKLRRYSTALEHISKCSGHFDECLDLIQSHEMYKEALNLYDRGSENYNTICEMYGECLSGKRKYEEAGIIFTHCQDSRKALESFSNSNNYSLALMTAFKLKLDRNEIVELAYKLAEKAKTTSRHLEAVEILEHHAHDIEQAVETALHAQLWQIALRMTQQHNRTDLNETHVLPSIKEAHENTFQILESHKNLIEQQTARLQTVRQLKEKQRMQALLDGVEGIGMDSDLYSDTSSTMAGSVTSRPSSTTSRSTGRSSKSRRKKERRGYSLKEGSRFEDLALLHSLKVAINAVDELSGDVKNLCLHLALLHMDSLAETLQKQYSEVRKIIGRLLPTIWSQDLIQNDQTMTTGPQSTVNSIVASMQNRRSDRNDNNEEKRDFKDLDLFVTPKFDSKSQSWMTGF